MQITDIRIRRLQSESRILATVSIVLNEVFMVHEIKIIEGFNRIFVAMPSQKDISGVFHDIVHPISVPVRHEMEEQILAAYHSFLEQYKISKTD